MVSFELDAGENLTFVWCPPGYYKQATRGTSLSHKTGVGNVEVVFSKGFWMLNTPITNGHWKSITGESYFEVGSFSRKAPVYGLNLEMILSFINKLNGLNLKSESLKGGITFSLPNYLQMRYGCFSRVTDNQPSFWELNDEKFSDYCWFNQNSDNSIHDVGLKKTSPWGLYDMFGNILEMSSDVMAVWAQNIIVDPKSVYPVGGTLFAVGGDYNSSFEKCVSPMHSYIDYYNEYSEPYGFRLVF